MKDYTNNILKNLENMEQSISIFKNNLLNNKPLSEPLNELIRNLVSIVLSVGENNSYNDDNISNGYYNERDSLGRFKKKDL